MFTKNDYVIYGSEGVCLVADIRPISFDLARMAEGEHTYYVLSPMEKQDAYVYVPIDSEVLCAKMRRVLTKEEIDSAIDLAAKKPLPDLNDRKRRAVIYRSVCESMKCELLLLLVRALYERKNALSAQGKKMAFSDSEMLSKCEAVVASEFAFSLGIEKCEVSHYIQARLDAAKE